MSCFCTFVPFGESRYLRVVLIICWEVRIVPGHLSVQRDGGASFLRRGLLSWEHVHALHSKKGVNGSHPFMFSLSTQWQEENEHEKESGGMYVWINLRTMNMQNIGRSGCSRCVGGRPFFLGARPGLLGRVIWWNKAYDDSGERECENERTDWVCGINSWTLFTFSFSNT